MRTMQDPGMNRAKRPVIAVSNRPFSSAAALVEYVLKTGCGGADYSFSYHAKKREDLDADIPWIEKIGAAGIEVRYHCPFYEVELAHAKEEKATRSLAFLKECVEFVSDFGGQCITVHIGLSLEAMTDIDYETAIAHLSELVEFGNRKGVVVFLENLTKGWTSEPISFSEIIRKTGAAITFDLGHANACPWVRDQNRVGLDFLKPFSGQVVNAHVYEIEKINPRTHQAYHQFPRDLGLIAPLLEELLGKRCDWWLIELNKLEDVEHTRSLLQAFLNDAGHREV